MLKKIVSIEKIGEMETLDISLDGDNLFFANGILTHNSGWDNSDVGLENTAESFGLPATADFMAALITNDNLQQIDQMMVKQLKNRYRDKSKDTKFIIGIKTKYMKLYDVEDTAQSGLVNTNQTKVPTTSTLPNMVDEGEKEFYKKQKEKQNNKFEGFKL